VGQKKLGLALGGGGARGLAHIGVLKILEQASIPIHCIAGTSMGAIVGAAYAAGISPQELELEALHLSKKRQLIRMTDFGLGRGLISSKRVRSLFIDKWGLEKSFDQLRIPVAAVATNLNRRCCVTIDQGSVIDAVMASSSFPGVLPPVEINGEFLVDGFIFNNVPADVARRLGAEVVLAVDVIAMNPDKYREEQASFDLIHLRAPGIPQALYQAVWMMVAAMSETNLASAQAEIILFPPVPADLSIILGFARPAEAIAAGEQAAAQALDKIMEAING
jgi:NTE family protein